MNTQHLNSSLKKNSLRSHSNDINQKFCYFYKKRHTRSCTETENKPERLVERDHEMHTGRQRRRGNEGQQVDQGPFKVFTQYLLSAYYVPGTILNSGIEQKINDTKISPLAWPQRRAERERERKKREEESNFATSFMRRYRQKQNETKDSITHDPLRP